MEPKNEHEIHARIRYVCGYCGANSNDLGIFESTGSCTNCGGMNPEYHFFLEGKTFPGSVLVYFAKDADLAGRTLVATLEQEGWNVITHDEIDFRSIDRESERNLIRDRLGGILIIPSAGLVNEESDTLTFLYEANRMVPFGKIAKTVFVLSDHKQAKHLENFHYKYNESLTALSLTGDADMESYRGVSIASSGMMERFLDVYSKQRLKKN